MNQSPYFREPSSQGPESVQGYGRCAPAASQTAEASHASATTKEEPSAQAKPTPEQAKGEKESPATKGGNLTAQHFSVGDKVETKSGKKGVITHVHKKSGYLFIHDPGEGKTYHVSWGSVTKLGGKNVADILAKQGDGLGEDLKAAADKMVEGPAATALKSHGWKAVKTDSMGAVTYDGRPVPCGRGRDAHQRQQRDRDQAGEGGRVPTGVPRQLREAGRGSRQAEGGRGIHSGGQAYRGHPEGRLHELEGLGQGRRRAVL
jgi:hypothetical protein